MSTLTDIPCLFERADGHLIDKVTPGCEWVAEGLGTPTRVYEGVHGVHLIQDVPRTFDSLRYFLWTKLPMIDGIVWWYIEDTHPRIKKPPKLARLLRLDFGLEEP